MREPVRFLVAVAAITGFAAFLNPGGAFGFGKSIVSVDTTSDSGFTPSLALDSSGYPVVSYWDGSSGDLKVLHCNDPKCVGNSESLTTPDSSGTEGGFFDQTALALDALGNPVVAYTSVNVLVFKVLHCNDPNCAPGGDSIKTLAPSGAAIFGISLDLDAAGNPAISYVNDDTGALGVIHCNDPDCDPLVNGSESIETPDTSVVTTGTSLELDGAGNPVVSYAKGGLRLLRCDDPNCVGDAPIVVDNSDLTTGESSSLSLDSVGRPVVGYYDPPAQALKVVHCNDLNCSGMDETPIMPDTEGSSGGSPSLALDGLDRPVVSYYDASTGDLKVLHCNDVACAGGDDIARFVDIPGTTGYFTSLVLDSSGIPVVSYHDYTNGDLRVLRCGNANCSSPASITSPDSTAADVGLYTSVSIDASRKPVIAYYDNTNDNLKILHCNDINCAGGDESPTTPDSTGDVGVDTSIALDSAGNPVVSYSDVTNGTLKILHCNDPNCDSAVNGPESVTSPVTGIGTGLGHHSSLVLDGSGRPVVAFHDRTTQDLRILHCNDLEDPSLQRPELRRWRRSGELPGSTRGHREVRIG
jgi:hypothetical protein